MYVLYGHPRYFKFRRKFQQYDPCFQITFPFLMTMNILKKGVVKQVKTCALLRFSPSLDTNKRKAIYTTMVKSQLNYCPLIWIFCPRKPNNLINKVQKRALRITYNDRLTDFYLLWNHNEITIHQGNLQVLMTEIYKIINCSCNNVIFIWICENIYLKYVKTLSSLHWKQETMA